MSEIPVSVWISLIGMVLGSTVIAALINARVQSRKTPIEKRAADVAELSATSDIATGLRTELVNENTSLKAEKKAWEAEKKTWDAQLATIRREFNENIRTLSIRIYQLEVANTENRNWMRRAYKLILDHVPPPLQIPPPPEYPDDRYDTDAP